MRVAVTGGTGFIGSHVVDALVDAGHDVTVIDVRAPHRGDVGHAPADINDLDALVAATAGCEAVFHLAAYADVNDVAADPVGATESNVGATAKVWEACRRNGVRRAVLASTVWVYGAAPDGDGDLDESSPFDLARAGHLYTASKLAAELVVQSYQELYGLDFTILRYGIPYGPRMRPSLVIPKFIDMARNGDPITVHGDGSQHRNYVYVEDLARAHVLALGEAGRNQVLNLEGDERVTIRDLVDAIGVALDITPNVTYTEARAGDYEGRAISNAKARDVLGWAPTVPFSDGLRRTVDWKLAPPAPVPAATPAAAGDASQPAAVPWWRAAAVGCTAAAGILPMLVRSSQATPGDRVASIVTVLAALGAVLGLQRWRRKAPMLSLPVGAGALLAVVWLLSQTEKSAQLLPLGLLFAFVFARTFPVRWMNRHTMNVALSGAAVLSAVDLVHGEWTAWAAAVAVLAGTLVAAAPRIGVPRAPAVSWRMSAGALLATSLVGSVVGASSASASWFGPVTAHGPRDTAEVAITFDGSDPAAVEPVVQVLDASDVKATFFARADAVASDPTLARELLAGGHLVEDAGFQSNLPLDARPGDVARSQRIFAQQLGVCPSYIRPANGVHTPLTARLASQQSMRLVTWDVRRTGAGGSDAARLAAAVLASAEPGSIIRLSLRHRDGDAAAVAGALPMIINGLRERHLSLVRLDQLLGSPGYTSSCA